jgi:uncharacterized protein (TIGR00661 family)
MANILYGVNGEGAGHSTRSRETILHLQRQGHSVIAASFDRGLRNLSDVCEVLEIHGFRFTYVNNQVRYNRTLARSLFHAGKASRGISELTRLIDERGIELVITDFEPLTCRAGRRRKLPVISIDNQHIMTDFKMTMPPGYRTDATACKMLVRMMTPYADHYLVTSFFDAPSRRRNSELVPPILRQQIQDAVPSSDGPILVYVTSPAPQLIKLLSSVRAEFIAYGFNREGREGNILYKKPGFETFFDDLVHAQGIIANAGFSLVTEALHLGKPYLAVPVRNQFEQIFNAFWLGRTGYGAFWEELTKERVESFLYNLPHFREKLAEYPRTSNRELFAKLDALIAASLTEFVNKPLVYRSGETIMKGDRVLFHGEPGEVEFIVDRIVGDPEMDWYMQRGPGVMVREPKVFGRVFISDTERTEDLVFLARGKP